MTLRAATEHLEDVVADARNAFMEQVVEQADEDIAGAESIEISIPQMTTDVDYAPYLKGDPLDRQVSFRFDLPEGLLAMMTIAEKARAHMLEKQVAVDTLRVYRDRLQERKDMLDSIPDDEDRFMYAGDTWSELTDVVRTVEVPDEIQNRGIDRILIYPGYWGGADYAPERDGQLHARESQSAAQAVFNTTILPGVQRWRPGFRFAKLMNVDKIEHTAEIQYESMDSSAQKLLITAPEAKRLEVPIEYMECNSHVFEDGDQALVELEDRDWQKPKIIGFRSKPKHCPIIMTYDLGWLMANNAYADSDPTGYSGVPAGVFRDRGITHVEVKLWEGDGLTILFSRDLQQVINATVQSELPQFSAWSVLTRPLISKGTFSMPTVSMPRNVGGNINVPVNGSHQYVDSFTGATGLYPINKPPDPHHVEPDRIDVTFRQYWAQNFEFYDVGTHGQVHYSNQVNTTQLAGEVEISLFLEDFPDVITWLGVDHVKEEFVNFVPFDFDNNRGAAGPWRLDSIAILYRPVQD